MEPSEAGAEILLLADQYHAAARKLVRPHYVIRSGMAAVSSPDTPLMARQTTPLLGESIVPVLSP